MTLGYAIPSCKSYLNYTYRVLEQIDNSTIVPDEVVVSISDTEIDIPLREDFNFPIKWIRNPNSEEGCTNRNIAAENLTTDIITFMDCDDLVHPQRNEFILKAFNQGAETLVHSYVLGDRELQSDLKKNKRFLDNKHKECVILREYLTSFGAPIGPQNDIDKNVHYHNAHVSVTKDIFSTLKYEVHPFCDSYYTRKLVENGHKIWYIPNELSYYILVK